MDTPTPHRDLTPDACRSLSEVIVQSLDKLRSWGVRIPPSGAHMQARRWLNQLADRATLETLSTEELRRTSEAGALAVDLYHITAMLGEEPNELVSHQLARLVRGWPTTTRDVRQYMAQFWVGVLLAQSGLKPTILAIADSHRPTPDYLAAVGTAPYAVEVKCPGSRRGAHRLLDSAAEQLSARREIGVIALDLTYATGLDPMGVCAPNEAPMRDRFRDAHQELHDALVADVEEHAGAVRFARVSLLLTFARFWSWNVRDSATERDAGLVFILSIFPDACSGLVTHVAVPFSEALVKGVESLTGNPPEVRVVKQIGPGNPGPAPMV
jgi:hypothetical protein